MGRDIFKTANVGATTAKQAHEGVLLGNEHPQLHGCLGPGTWWLEEAGLQKPTACVWMFPSVMLASPNPALKGIGVKQAKSCSCFINIRELNEQAGECSGYI